MLVPVLLLPVCSAVAVSGLGIPRQDGNRLKSRGGLYTRQESLAGLTFQTIPIEQVKADAERIGVFQPQADHNTARNHTTADKAAASTNDDAGTAAGTCTDPAVRIEWRDMSPADRTGFISAVQCLLSRPSAGEGTTYPGSQNRYEDLVAVHQQLTSAIHMVGQFLPWHRYFLSIYESLLREECGLTGPMPWWDEAKDAGNFGASPLFTDEYFGPLPAKTADGQSTCLTTGPFTMTLHIGPGGGQTDHCLSRGVDESLTSQCSADFSNYCNSYTDYSDMEKCAEGGPHAYCHNGIGAVMADVASSVGDPVFFMHHSFIDHNWRIWQNADVARLTQIDGATSSDGSGVLNLDYVLTSRGLRPDVTVRDVMDTMGGYLCYRYSY